MQNRAKARGSAQVSWEQHEIFSSDPEDELEGFQEVNQDVRM